MPKSIDFSTFLTKTSKTLRITSKVIPIYQDTSPLIKNIKDFLINKKENDKKVFNKENNTKIINNSKKTITNKSNRPRFFV